MTYLLTYLLANLLVKTATLIIYICKYLIALYFHTLIRVFCTLLICFVFDGFFVVDSSSNV